MKFAFSRPTSSNEQRDRLFNNYQKLSYEGLHLKHSQYAPYIEEPERFNEEWANLDGIASGLIFGGNLDRDNQQVLRKLFAFASQVGTDSIIFCHGVPREQSSNERLHQFAKQLTELGKEAWQDYGIQLSLHHHYNQPVMYREDFDVFFDQIKDNDVTLTIDTAHLYKSGIKDIAEVIRSFKDRIDNFHMKDFANGDWKVLGQGEIDFEPIFQAVKEIGYDGWMSADEESGGEIIGGMKECLDFMRKGLNQYPLLKD
ncbi:sugar phosphate isomerase/epimerase family protein [Gracilibacillus sp. D59]|uniref:sugar phosphate isomerase/epimerase family protein n=1 Tax=Gracilibacillus sp. D59 TaxID=3457434 RepID=UPI003FCDA3CB